MEEMAVFGGGRGRQEQAGGLGPVRGEPAAPQKHGTAGKGSRAPQTTGGTFPRSHVATKEAVAELKTSPSEQAQSAVTQLTEGRSVLTLLLIFVLF